VKEKMGFPVTKILNEYKGKNLANEKSLRGQNTQVNRLNLFSSIRGRNKRK
jgi:hypothetical protein